MARTSTPSRPSRVASTGRTLLWRGLLGGRSWQLGLGLALFGLSTARRIATRREETVYLVDLQPGQKLVISHLEETRG